MILFIDINIDFIIYVKNIKNPYSFKAIAMFEPDLIFCNNDYVVIMSRRGLDEDKCDRICRLCK